MMPIPRPLVSAAWLTNHLDDVVLADVRWYLDGRSGADAYAAGHLPGAIFVDLDTDLSAPAGPGGRHPLPHPDAFAGAMSALGIGDGTVVVAYDDAGGIIAGRMWWMLDSLGIEVAVLDGGIDAWTGPLETQPRSAEPASFTPRQWPKERFATADEVAHLSDDVSLIDARSGDRYAGVENPIDPRFGHIPGARSAPSADVIGDDGSMLPSDEVADHFAAIGIDTSTPVVAYCGSGVSACADLIALRSIGHTDHRLYVGSWSEWGADLDRPVETGTDGAVDQEAP